MIWRGVFLALSAAVTHTAIDSTRKYAASNLGIPSDGLVTVPSLLDAVIALLGVTLSGQLKGRTTVQQPTTFLLATVTSSLLLLVSRYMYQRAIHISPLSLTIPYLAFTPAILIATAYVFLGECPSASGLVGVSIVALGGYLLNIRASSLNSSVAPSSNAGMKDADTSAAAMPSLQQPSSLMQRASSSMLSLDIEDPSPKQGPSPPAMPLVSHTLAKRVLSSRQLKRAVSAADIVLRQPLMAMQQEPGTLLMIGVAIIWSVTASLDKLGVIMGPSIWTYFAAQRLTIGVFSLIYILWRQPRLLLLLRDRFLVLLCLSLLELAAVVLFLEAVQYLLVSYVVAIKRCNVLFSVVLGALIFRENVGSRMPYIFLMMCGMTLIVLEPGSYSLTHSHT